MLNQTVLVGRIVTLDYQEKGKALMTISCPRPYKNNDGEYDTDFIKVRLTDSVADNTNEYCKKGDIVGIKGRLQNINDNNDTEIFVEKVTFLSSTKPND